MKGLGTGRVSKTTTLWSNAWTHLLQTPWMAHMVPLQHRTEVLMAGVVRWGPKGGAWGPTHMAPVYHGALGISFQSAGPKKYLDALLYGLTLAWGTEIMSFNWTPDDAAVSFAICDLASREPARPRGLQIRRHTGGAPSAVRAVQLFGRLAVLETHTLRY